MLFHSRYEQFLLQAALQSRTFHTLTLRLLINSDSIFNSNNTAVRSFFNTRRDFIILLTMKIKNQYGCIVTRCYPCVSLGMCLIFCTAPEWERLRRMWTAFGANSRAFPEPFLIMPFRQMHDKTLAHTIYCCSISVVVQQYWPFVIAYEIIITKTNSHKQTEQIYCLCCLFVLVKSS